MNGKKRVGTGFRDLRHGTMNWLALLFAFGIVAGLFSIAVEGQSQRPRKVTESSQQNTSQRESKSLPKPALKQPTTAETQSPQAPAKPTAPQQTQPQKDQTPEIDAEPIKIKSNLVAVPVSVTNGEGQPVRNLTAEDFLLEEEGQLQQLQTMGQPGKTPIELALLFDVSRSVRNRFDFEREAAGRFLKEVLKPGDSVSVFTIGRNAKLAVERTENVEKAIAQTGSIEPTDEWTAFFDSVVRAAQYLDEKAIPGTRKVMVIISDGEDTNSERFRLSDALRELQRGDSLFYAINPSGPSIKLNKISMRGHDGMIRLANETGGLAFLPERLEDLDRVFVQIANELQAQYLLGYYSSNERNDGAFRKITVRVPKKAELRVRARQGYYAPKE